MLVACGIAWIEPTPHSSSSTRILVAQKACFTRRFVSKQAGGHKTTPAMAAGIVDYVWTYHDIAKLLD